MGDKKRFSEDFTHWNDAIPTAFRCMVEDPTTGEEYWVTREQLITGVTIGNMGGASAYDIYKATTSNIPVLSETDWINSLYGHDGITPTIGSNGNWFTGSTDTGVKAQPENPIPQAQIYNAPMGAIIFFVGLLSGLSDSWHLANGDTVEGFGKTQDMRGKVPLGYDPAAFATPTVATGMTKNYGAIGNIGGKSFVTLDKTQIPALKVTLPGQRGGDNNDNSNITAFAGGDKGPDEKSFNFSIEVNTEAGDQAHENRMEYVVGAFIQRVKPEVVVGDGKSAYDSYKDTTTDNPILTEAQWELSLHGTKGDKGDTGSVGNTGAKGDTGTQGPKGDTGAQGNAGTPGTSVPVNVALFRVNSGVVPMVDFGWISNLVVSAVVLGATASDISATINGTVYNKTTIIGVSLPAGAKMTNLDVVLLAGETNANALIIF